jgi:hypothetical protein
MNYSPWHVEHTANYQRQRILDDMRQIRLEQTAMKAADREAMSSRSKATALQAVRHATLAVAEAVLSMFV